MARTRGQITGHGQDQRLNGRTQPGTEARWQDRTRSLVDQRLDGKTGPEANWRDIISQDQRLDDKTGPEAMWQDMARIRGLMARQYQKLGSRTWPGSEARWQDRTRSQVAGHGQDQRLGCTLYIREHSETKRLGMETPCIWWHCSITKGQDMKTLVMTSVAWTRGQKKIRKQSLMVVQQNVTGTRVQEVIREGRLLIHDGDTVECGRNQRLGSDQGRETPHS